MNVWIKRCRRKTKCLHCKEFILCDSFMVVTQTFKGKWTIKRYYHTECWVKQGVEKLGCTPKAKRARKRTVPDDIRDARLAILRRRAAAVQRIRLETDKPPETWNINRIAHLGEILNQLEVDIGIYGGVPKSWK